MQIRDFLLGLGLGSMAWLIAATRRHARKTDSWSPKVAAVGGGTGLSMLLRGLKKYSSNLSAIVTVTDDGGSSGRLRENLDMLPPGDIRNCLLALANTEPLLEKVFQYRFTAGEGLEGHNLGNLFLAALTDQFGFDQAVVAASRVLAVKGEVLPVSLDQLTLVARFDDGSIIRGESSIPKRGGRVDRIYLEPESAMVHRAAETAILEADIIVVGPGSLYTSVLANLLVPGVTEAIRQSKARKIYICNVMTQPGETDGYTASDHLRVIYDHVGYGLFDTVVVNSNSDIPAGLLEKYAMEGAFPVSPDREQLKSLGVHVIAADLLSQNEAVRHDPERLARIVLMEGAVKRS